MYSCYLVFFNSIYCTKFSKFVILLLPNNNIFCLVYLAPVHGQAGPAAMVPQNVSSTAAVHPQVHFVPHHQSKYIINTVP